jgi:exosortase A
MAAVIPHASDAARAVNGSRFAAVVAVLLVVPLLFLPATLSIAALWVNGDLTTYTHGYLILAVSLWLLWQVRADVSEPDTAPWPAWQRAAVLAVLIGVLLAWQLAYRAGIQIAVEVLLLPVLWLAVLGLFGWRAARAIAFPLFYLLFAIPVWDYLNPAAQWVTVYVVRFLLRVFGIPAYFESNFVLLPDGEFEIAHGCSGLHFIMVGLAIGALIGHLRGDGLRMRLRWLALAAVLAILTNWVRVFTIIAVGHYTHMQHYLIRENHYYYGWGLFVVALAVLFFIEYRTPLGAKREAVVSRSAVPSAQRPGFLIPVCLLLVAPFAVNSIITARLADSTPAAELSQPRGWTAASATDSDWRPLQHGADREEHTRFSRDGADVEFYSATYLEQRLGKKLGGYGNRLGGEAEVVQSGSADVAGRRFGASELKAADRRFLLWYSYEVAGRSFTSATRAQLWYSWLSLWTLRSPPSKAVAIGARCGADCAAASTVLEKFVSEGGVFREAN